VANDAAADTTGGTEEDDGEMADDGPAFVAYNGCSTEYDVVIVVLFIYNSIQIYFYITIGEKYL
jgi:hypothetical protein